uniref:Pantothenate synthetase n=1 Tax=Anthurium amnicola TaxID=1678845 RepID=A0A1D1YNR2_9ARAE
MKTLIVRFYASLLIFGLLLPIAVSGRSLHLFDAEKGIASPVSSLIPYTARQLKQAESPDGIMNKESAPQPTESEYHGAGMDSHHGVDLRKWEWSHPKTPPQEVEPVGVEATILG